MAKPEITETVTEPLETASLESQLEAYHDKRERRLEQGTNLFDRIGLKFNAEIRGVERVPEDKRVDTNWTSPLTMFLSPSMSIAALSTGMLGPTFYKLDFRTCVLVIVFWSIIGSMAVGFFATFGARFGLRQQMLSRYFTGNVMGRIFALFNVISCCGWNAVNILPSVQMLASIGPLPPWAGCIILVVVTCMVALLGYKAIHIYERYSWIPNFIIYLIVIARLTMSGNFTWGTMESGTQTAGNVLNFISTVFGYTAGWSSSSADFFVYMPSETPSWKIFGCMVVGLSTPCIFTLTLGAACAMGTLRDPTWKTAFDDGSVGGLVNMILNVNNLHGFGRFCMVVLGLSSIANNWFLFVSTSSSGYLAAASQVSTFGLVLDWEFRLPSPSHPGVLRIFRNHQQLFEHHRLQHRHISWDFAHRALYLQTGLQRLRCE